MKKLLLILVLIITIGFVQQDWTGKYEGEKILFLMDSTAFKNPILITSGGSDTTEITETKAISDSVIIDKYLYMGDTTDGTKAIIVTGDNANRVLMGNDSIVWYWWERDFLMWMHDLVMDDMYSAIFVDASGKLTLFNKSNYGDVSRINVRFEGPLSGFQFTAAAFTPYQDTVISMGTYEKRCKEVWARDIFLLDRRQGPDSAKHTMTDDSLLLQTDNPYSINNAVRLPNLFVDTIITGSQYSRGSGSFDSQQTQDTVLLSGATINDIYTITSRGNTPVLYSVEAKNDTFIVFCKAADTTYARINGYNWRREK